MTSILVYTDKGACPLSVKCLLDSLHALQGKHSIKMIDSQFLSTQEWEKETWLLIMPGGRDRPYQAKLQGQTNQRIQQFVKKCGSYLGLCAGAYYACSSIEFEKDTPLEVIAERELGFFSGLGKGPAYGVGQFQYESSSGAKIASLLLSDAQKCSIYYNGGCFFTPINDNVDVLARYENISDQPAAIIHTQFGLGHVVLSGVHPEFKASSLPASHPFRPILQPLEQEHQKLFHLLFSFLSKNLS